MIIISENKRFSCTHQMLGQRLFVCRFFYLFLVRKGKTPLPMKRSREQDEPEEWTQEQEQSREEHEVERAIKAQIQLEENIVSFCKLALRPSKDDPRKNYTEILQVKGDNRHAVVYSAKLAQTGNPVFLKVMCKDKRAVEDVKNNLLEVYILTQLKNHPFICELQDFHIGKKNDLWIEMPRYTTTLEKLWRGKNCRLHDDDIRDIMYQLLIALKFCHSKNVLHGDVKMDNIFLEANAPQLIKGMNFPYRLRLGDFGTSRIAAFQASYNGIDVNPETRKPPEALLKMEIRQSVDIWAAGTVLVLLFSNREWDKRVNVGCISLQQQLDFVNEFAGPLDKALGFSYDDPAIRALGIHKPTSIPVPVCEYFTDVRPPARILMTKMLLANPRMRASAKVALCDNFFKELRMSTSKT